MYYSRLGTHLLCIWSGTVENAFTRSIHFISLHFLSLSFFLLPTNTFHFFLASGVEWSGIDKTETESKTKRRHKISEFFHIIYLIIEWLDVMEFFILRNRISLLAVCLSAIRYEMKAQKLSGINYCLEFQLSNAMGIFHSYLRLFCSRSRVWCFSSPKFFWILCLLGLPHWYRSERRTKSEFKSSSFLAVRLVLSVFLFASTLWSSWFAYKIACFHIKFNCKAILAGYTFILRVLSVFFAPFTLTQTQLCINQFLTVWVRSDHSLFSNTSIWYSASIER